MIPPTQRSHIQNVLSFLLRHPGATRPQLCGLTGLTPSAMHGIIDLLKEQGIINLTGTRTSSGGRRAGEYSLRPDLGTVIGVSVRLDEVSAGIFDIGMNLLAETRLELHLSAMGPESYAGQISVMVEQLLSQNNLSPCFGLGITVPGSISLSQDTVQQICGAPLWQNFPLAKRLSHTLGIPVLAEKDVYAGIEYLELSGHIHRPKCAAYLSICEGIGAALMLDGHAFRGGHSLSGEIGHLTVRKDGIPCRCGNVGCLELYCSDLGIVRQYNFQSGASLPHVEDVLEKLEQGDAIATKVVAQAISYLVDTTSSIIMSYDPEELVIYCRWLNSQRALYFKMLDVLYSKSIFTQKHQVDIRLLPPEPIYLSAAATLAITGLMLAPEGRLLQRLQSF